MGIAHEQSAQLRAKGSRMELMVLSVEHIRAFGLESDVLPAHTIFVAAIVALAKTCHKGRCARLSTVLVDRGMLVLTSDMV